MKAEEFILTDTQKKKNIGIYFPPFLYEIQKLLNQISFRFCM